MIQIHLPLDTCGESRDSSCFGSLQFLVRRSQLDAICTMRSQSAVRVMPYDLFVLTMLHEMVALELGIPVGSYHHFAGSMHYYVDEEELVELVLTSPPSKPEPMPAMETAVSLIRPRLVRAERELRRANYAARVAAQIAQNWGLDAYWSDLLATVAEGQTSHEVPSTAAKRSA